MKQRVLVLTIALLASFAAAAQTTNPLNYSGRMYVAGIEVYSTPRYNSYEDHAILTKTFYVPAVENNPYEADFERNVISISHEPMKVMVDSVKKYPTDFMEDNVVIYMHLIRSGDPAEIVWPAFGVPYFQQISNRENGKEICRFLLVRDALFSDGYD
jgi:hypothetical protein